MQKQNIPALLRPLLRFYCLQRCGYALDSNDAGVYAHAACHNQTASVYGTDERIDVSGGWHDAGDYGRYTVPGAKAAADLLLSYLDVPELFDTLAFLPDGVRRDGSPAMPELLTEVCWELSFLLKMQRGDGGVYHKVTCAHFCGFILPDQERDELIVSPVSTTATGDFAGVMALAAFVYRAFDTALSERMLEAAQRAYAFVGRTSCLPFSNPAGVDTGEYGDECDTDERFFAAAALYAVTGENGYLEDALALISTDIPMELGWADMGGYGALVCLRLPRQPGGDALYALLLDRLGDRAKHLLSCTRRSPLNISLDGEFLWGSNMYLINNAVVMAEFGRLTGQYVYEQAARGHLAYLLGANPLARCYITGLSGSSPKHPHHRPSAAAGQPMPGMLVGGPDAGLHDPCAKETLAGLPPACCYTDRTESYSTNEVAIYWNSPLVYLIALLSCLKK